MRAKRGDHIIVGTVGRGRPARRGRVLEVLGQGTDERYLVAWRDGHESVCVPGRDVRVLQVG